MGVISFYFIFTLLPLHYTFIPPTSSFIDFGAAAPCIECTQLILGDSELLSNSARPCGHAIIRAV